MSPSLFDFNGSAVRVIHNESGPLFVAKDICQVFGDSDHKRSVSRVDEDDRKMVEVLDSMGRVQTATAVNESGLYSLLFMMQPEKARMDGGAQNDPHVLARITRLKSFRRWVTHEVLPAIRQTGAYALPGLIPSNRVPANFVEALRLAADAEEQRMALQLQLEDAAPKLEVYDRVMASDGLFIFREVAAMLAESNLGGNNLVKRLLAERILYRDQKGHLLAYRQYIEAGHFKAVETPYEIKATGESRVSCQIKVTTKGVDFIARKLGTTVNYQPSLIA